jgi:DNA-binding MarR family transcriptional regulator
MTTPSGVEQGRPLADLLVEFVQAFDTWSRRAAVTNARESVPRLRLLYELHCNGPRKMADLADVLGVTPRNVTALVDGLEAEDLVRRRPHPTDRRVTMIEITGGAAEVEEQVGSLRQAIDGLLGTVSEKDRQTLARVLATLEDKIHTGERQRGALAGKVGTGSG